MTGRRHDQTLEFTDMFLEGFISRDFTAADRQRFLRALRLLDTNERHPSLQVYPLRGNLQGLWSASASDELRMTFERLEGGGSS